MKRLYFLTGAAALSLCIADLAHAATPGSSWYAGVSGDATWTNHSSMGGGGNISLGYQCPNNFRLEAEAGYHGAPGSGGYSSTHYFTYMGNVYYDFKSAFPASGSGWHTVPYIGGGLGDAAIHPGNSSLATTFHHHENKFAYQGMAGLEFTSASMPSTDWTLGYRYLGTSSGELHANNIELGVRFHF